MEGFLDLGTGGLRRHAQIGVIVAKSRWVVVVGHIHFSKDNSLGDESAISVIGYRVPTLRTPSTSPNLDMREGKLSAVL